MKKTLLALIAFASLGLSAQTILPTVSATSATAGQSVTLTVSYGSGTSAAAGVQWSTTLPTGATISAWTAGASTSGSAKTITCGPVVAQVQACVDVGLNATAIPSGVLGTAVVTLPTSARGAQTVTEAGTFGASSAGSAVTVTGGAISLTALSPFDLNGNGLGTQALILAVLVTAVNQVVKTTACTTANFLNDGCTIDDLEFLIADLLSPTP